MGLLVVELRPKGEALGFDLDWEAKRAAALRAADDRITDLAAANEAIFVIVFFRWEKVVVFAFGRGLLIGKLKPYGSFGMCYCFCFPVKKYF